MAINNNEYNQNPKITELEAKIKKETENLRKLIYVYDNGTSHIKVFEEVNPQTGGKKYWCEQWGVNPGNNVWGKALIHLAVEYINEFYDIKTSAEINSDSIFASTGTATNRGTSFSQTSTATTKSCFECQSFTTVRWYTAGEIPEKTAKELI